MAVVMTNERAVFRASFYKKTPPKKQELHHDLPKNSSVLDVVYFIFH